LPLDLLKAESETEKEKVLTAFFDKLEGFKVKMEREQIKLKS